MSLSSSLLLLVSVESVTDVDSSKVVDIDDKSDTIVLLLSDAEVKSTVNK